MEAIAGIVAFGLIASGVLAAAFLVAVQPIWGIVDVAISERSNGEKAVLILLTLLLLGPLLTFFYALFGSRTPAFKKATLWSLLVVVGCFGTLFVLSVFVASIDPGRYWPEEDVQGAVPSVEPDPFLGLGVDPMLEPVGPGVVARGVHGEDS